MDFFVCHWRKQKVNKLKLVSVTINGTIIPETTKYANKNQVPLQIASHCSSEINELLIFRFLNSSLQYDGIEREVFEKNGAAH